MLRSDAIQKPFAPNLLYARIGRLLRERSKAILELSFEYASHRRSCYDCLSCLNV